MEEFYKPDKRWEFYNIESKEQYAEHLIVKGYFHDQVPKDVVKEFTTAEYLMAHAYYYWPMYDEALSKCVFTVEVAIKQKATELNIPITFKTKKGITKDRRLVEIINDLVDLKPYSDFEDKLHRIRELRNLKAHPKWHGFAGPNGADQYIKHIVNTLNRLFNSKKELEFHNQQIEFFSKKLHTLNEHVLKVKGQGDPFLLSCIHSFQHVDRDLIMSAFPMRSTYKSTPEGFDTEYPNTYLFNEYLFKDDGFKGVTKEGLTITISATDKPQNVKAKEERDAYIKQLDESQKAVFISTMNYQANWEIVKAEYEYNKQRYKSEKE